MNHVPFLFVGCVLLTLAGVVIVESGQDGSSIPSETLVVKGVSPMMASSPARLVGPRQVPMGAPFAATQTIDLGGPQYDQASGAGPVAIAASAYTPPSEHDYLAAALAALGHVPVDVTSTAEAAAAGADALVVYAGGWTTPGLAPADLAAWVDAGHGLIEIGDWHPYIPSSWEGPLPTPTVVTVTLNDRGHPVVHGLEPSWQGRGFFYNAWPDGAIGFALETLGEVDLAQLFAPGFPSHDFGVAALERDLGAGRAGRSVYLGLNLAGPAAGANEAALLEQALHWITSGDLFADGFEYGTTEAWSGTVP
jgi:hypothetical protein